ncbi:hypothetical protein G6F22_021315 [Rhizopus arrhizus]|nr:hypothetical protein G6F22_021315 [Rhizopus arrhizus]
MTSPRRVELARLRFHPTSGSLTKVQSSTARLYNGSYRDLLARSAWIFGGGWNESLRASAQNAWNTAWSGTLCSSSPGSR